MANKQLPLDLEIDIKSPIFTPRPGWGGKLKKWLGSHFESQILPLLAIASVAMGMYLSFIR